MISHWHFAHAAPARPRYAWVAPLEGPLRHFINEIEIHPGYYVDWDDTPDETIEPLADAYGAYIVRVLEEAKALDST